MTHERPDLRFPVFSACVLALAASVALPTLYFYPAPASGPSVSALVFLLAVVVVSESITVMVPGSGAISLSVPLFVAIAVFAGPSAALIAGVVATIPLAFSMPRLSLSKLAFNLGNAVLTTILPALAYVWLGGIPVMQQSASAGPPWALLPAATLGTVVNFFLMSLAVTALYGGSVRSFLRTETLSFALPSQLALGLVGIAIAKIMEFIGIPGFALFVLPLLVSRQTYQQSVLLRQSYSDTIGSVVAALEAKDVYTKGHSLRVSKYAGDIARTLGMSVARVTKVENAALLHDLGKVGVSRKILGKNGRLTDEEYEEIKRHPDIGAHILEDVPVLADLIPFIACHHERIDGGGYGRGMMGHEIPLEARILAVADSYDAMTSARPYRQAMEHSAAMVELRKGVDAQFDRDVVDAFEALWASASSEASDGVAGVAVLDA